MTQKTRAKDEEIYVVSHRRMPAVHPGGILRETVLPALGISKAEMARRLGVSRQWLHAIPSERKPVTPEMALRIGKLCGNGPGLWLRLQGEYDLARAERAIGDKVARIETMHAA